VKNTVVVAAGGEEDVDVELVELVGRAVVIAVNLTQHWISSVPGHGYGCLRTSSVTRIFIVEVNGRMRHNRQNCPYRCCSRNKAPVRASIHLDASASSLPNWHAALAG
jgi:hypothetical protein